MSITTTRLHVTPFSPELVASLLPPSILGQAQNISFHTIQTFPEKGYGFVDLPEMEAAKLKKRLHGSILKGQKISIEAARPKKRRQEEITEDSTQTTSSGISKPKSKRTKQDPNVIKGREISPNRRIKRGWTVAKSDSTSSKSRTKTTKEQPASKYSEKAELLFRARVPANKRSTESKKTKRKRPASASEVVHEFEKSTAQPSFLRDSTASDRKTAVEFVEGKGWVDKNGQIIESLTHKGSRNRRKEPPTSAPRDQKGRNKKESSMSSSGSDSYSESFHGSEARYSHGDDEPTPQITNGDEENREEPTPEIHPLEALFKKPQKPSRSSQEKDIAKPSLEVSTSFTFFDGIDRDDLEEEELAIPGTPFSSQDIRARGYRSAAPTPDTAHPSRWSSYERKMGERLSSEANDDDDDDDDDQSDQDAEATPEKARPKGKGAREESEFEKEFWEKRGENDRAWKQRRRETLKEKRKAENRARRKRNW